MIQSVRRCLVLCAHTDDEFGCAGTVARLVDAGAEVRYLALSTCEKSVPDGLPRDVLVHECREATARLGVAPEHVELGPFEVREFPRDRQAILEHLVALRREWTPDLVLLPSSTDHHQDHATVHQEGVRAFKHATLLGYELPQNEVAFHGAAFVALSERHLETKLHALAAYQSQAFRSYSTDTFVRSLATIRGVQAGTTYAEAFEPIRLVVPLG
ncbi:MAG: PIG-L deacetylase family protein [Bacteroidota bacterium]